MFLEEQGMPILKIALKRMLFDDALPEPFSVATQIFKSLITGVSKIRLLQIVSRQHSKFNMFALKYNVL
jgi:hypothetical protein